MKKVIGMLVLPFLLLFVFSGCATSELKVSSTMSKSIFMTPPSQDRRSVFVYVKNTSSHPVQLEHKIVEVLYARGYSIVTNPDDANYVLMANVLYLDKLRENSTSQGAIMGGMAGLVLNSGAGSGRSVLGAGILGALLGGFIANTSEDTIYQMQVDVSVREKTIERVLSSSSVSSGSAKIDSYDYGRSSYLGGGTTQSFQGDYIEHRTVVVGEAVKMDLSFEEAIPVLEHKIAKQIANIF
ncbi:MAG: complement resistance protein TraT [Sulfurospirillaceae bacterium]|nr:complement resistance protein TraT [Sulfurospirillaceae bacterium]MDD3463167.1 complement resistance protein TraT [Sulfurospirillaceae bacterium]